MTEQPQVIVIGGGPAGLASAYYLQQAGIPYLVLERTQIVGHTWASLYPSLHLNTSKWYSHLPNFKMPWHWPIFPTGKAYHSHIVGFAEKHDFAIRFGVEVNRLWQDDTALWHIETNAGEYTAPVVISATGRFGNPIWPNIPGLADDFTAEAIHAHDYDGPAPYVGKRVMVVGNGPSGVDIAPELGALDNTPPVLMSMRTGVVLRPRYPWGLPKHAWMILADHLPDALGKPLLKTVGDLKFEGLAKAGVRTPAPGEESGAAATRGPELLNAVKAGNVICVPGPRRFFGRCVELDDGTTHEIDAVILATGYRPVLHQYLDADYDTDDQDWPLRDERAWAITDADGKEIPLGARYPSDTGREVHGLPGLYLVGVFYKGKGAMYNFTVEANIAVEQIKARATTHVAHPQ